MLQNVEIARLLNCKMLSFFIWDILGHLSLFIAVVFVKVYNDGGQHSLRPCDSRCPRWWSCLWIRQDGDQFQSVTKCCVKFVKVSEIREFCLKQDKSNLARKKPRAAIFVLIICLSRVMHEWCAPRVRKLVPATLSYCISMQVLKVKHVRECWTGHLFTRNRNILAIFGN